ncbi:MAG: hypothetical protein IT462_06770 [Planctomycetes bacterium]|nr:hypothetical protein [Planctomycetota bacterium]
MMTARKLDLGCPLCGSHEILYTCEPRCCFNHVCTACKASFQTSTEFTGVKVEGPIESPGEKESGEPTARCAKCRSIDVVSLDDGSIACCACGAALKLVFLDVEKR